MMILRKDKRKSSIKKKQASVKKSNYEKSIYCMSTKQRSALKEKEKREREARARSALQEGRLKVVYAQSRNEVCNKAFEGDKVQQGAGKFRELKCEETRIQRIDRDKEWR